MKIDPVLKERLSNQHLVSPMRSAAEVVEWFGAVQAQDFYGSLWNIGQRLKSATAVDVEQAIYDRAIVRTWPMRGTLHFVSPKDVYWMLAMLAPRIIQRAKTNYKKFELDDKTFLKSRKLLERALTGNKMLTRTELYEVLQKGKVNIEGERGIHILNNSAMQGLLCVGPRIGKQHSFVLLEEWIPEKRVLSKEESLAELAKRYFTSHGPATIQDLSWWSGLTLTEAKLAATLAESGIKKEKIGTTEYYQGTASSSRSTGISHPVVNLLSWFDEFIIGYKDRSASFDPATSKFIVTPKNGVYSPLILINGKITGSWKATGKGSVDINPYRKLTAAETTNLDKVIKRYNRFIKEEK
jgi:hypothetical protein